MNPKLKARLDETSEDFLEEHRRRAMYFIRSNDGEMDVIMLKSRMAVNYKFLSKVINDEVLFELSSPTREININTLRISLTEYAEKYYINKVLKNK